MKHAAPEPAKKKTGSRIAVIILLVVLIGGFIFGAFMVIKTFLTAQHEKQTFDEVAGMIEDSTEVNDETGALRKYDELYNRNPDFFGWLKIEDTVINYPVMYTPQDSEYYLHRDFYGKYSESGCLFMDGDCPSDGSYALIYGHHMNNGSMFGELPKYREKDFYEKHKTIFFDTRFEFQDYEVVAAFYSRIYDEDDEEGRFCYYNYKDLSDPGKFNEYVSNVKELSIYDTGVTPKYGDRLITLSTCNYHTEEGRFVVVARRTEHKAGVTSAPTVDAASAFESEE